MKRIILQCVRLLIALAAGLALLWCCKGLFQEWIAAGLAPAKAAVVSSEGLPVDPDAFAAALQQSGFAAERYDAPLTAAMVQQFAAEGVSLIVAQPGSAVRTACMTAAAECGISLLLVGDAPAYRPPSAQNLWCLCFDRANGGETLGAQVSLAFSEGTLPDGNGNHLLDYVVVGDSGDAALHAALKCCEQYGAEPRACAPWAEPCDLFELETLWQEAATPELILCGTAEDAIAALGASARLGWRDAENPPRLAVLAVDAAEAETLAKTGRFCAILCQDTEQITALALQIAENVLANRAPSAGTGLHYNEEQQTFWLSYRPYSLP